ncbi:hypothetical protein KKP90_03435 [Methanothermococcus sp. SCGC AD-155-E23]|nr:hypothetical protein [Methanothermococcus sp. SCGC AD-155-E23]
MESIEKDLLLKDIYERIREIRRELKLKDVDFEILDVEVVYQKGETLLNLYVLSRSDKSTVIGPGGWVVGRLREYLRDRFPGDLNCRYLYRQGYY